MIGVGGKGRDTGKWWKFLAAKQLRCARAAETLSGGDTILFQGENLPCLKILSLRVSCVFLATFFNAVSP